MKRCGLSRAVFRQSLHFEGQAQPAPFDIYASTGLQNEHHSPWTYSPQMQHPEDMPTGLHELGSRIRERRKALGLTQEDLAAKAGIDRSYIGGVEHQLLLKSF